MTTVILEGKEYQLDIEQAEKLGLLKEKDNRVRNWEEFSKKYNKAYIVNETSTFPIEANVFCTQSQLTVHEAKALAAFSKLLKLRRDWVGGWEPQCNANNYFIFYNQNMKSFLITWFSENNRSLSFPTLQMAQEFLKTFNDLIEEAKILI